MASPEVIEQRLRLRRSELLQRAERVDADFRHERDPLVADFADQAIQRSNDEGTGQYELLLVDLVKPVDGLSPATG